MSIETLSVIAMVAIHLAIFGLSLYIGDCLYKRGINYRSMCFSVGAGFALVLALFISLGPTLMSQIAGFEVLAALAVQVVLPTLCYFGWKVISSPILWENER